MEDAIKDKDDNSGDFFGNVASSQRNYGRSAGVNDSISGSYSHKDNFHYNKIGSIEVDKENNMK